MAVSDIARKLERSVCSVKAVSSRWGISLAPFSVEAHDAYLCRELFKEGLTVEVIAHKMELSRRSVTRIVFSEGVI